MISPMTLMALAAATLSVATPILQREDSAVTIFARANPAAVKCPVNSWSTAQVDNAYQGLVNSANLPNKGKPEFGTKYYPHALDPSKGNPDIKTALDKIAECKTGQPDTTYLLFPITEPQYKGGNPGPDRVVAIVSGAKPYSSFTYCLALGHSASGDNSFEVCSAA